MGTIKDVSRSVNDFNKNTTVMTAETNFTTFTMLGNAKEIFRRHGFYRILPLATNGASVDPVLFLIGKNCCLEYRPILLELSKNTDFVVSTENLLHILTLCLDQSVQECLDSDVDLGDARQHLKPLLKNLEAFSFKFIARHLNIKNVIVTFKIASAYGDEKLIEECCVMIIENLIYLQKKLISFTLDEFIRVMATVTAKLNYSSFDEAKFSAMVKWIKSDRPKREASCEKILEHINLNMVSSDLLTRYALDDFLAKYDGIVDKVNLILSERFEGGHYENEDSCDEDENTSTPSKRIKRDECVAADDRGMVLIKDVDVLIPGGSSQTETILLGGQNWRLNCTRVETGTKRSYDNDGSSTYVLRQSCLELRLSLVTQDGSGPKYTGNANDKVIYCKAISSKLHVPSHPKMMAYKKQPDTPFAHLPPAQVYLALATNQPDQEERKQKEPAKIKQQYITHKFAKWDVITNPANGFLDENGHLKVQLEMYSTVGGKLLRDPALHVDWHGQHNRNSPLEMVPVERNGAEWNAVLHKFKISSMAWKEIVMIQRVENPELLQKFRAEKAAVSFQMTNTLRPVSRYLFHGTDADACQNICQNGFDQSKAKSNCAYGRGIYFASSSQLSDRYTYKAPTAPWQTPSSNIIANPSSRHANAVRELLRKFISNGPATANRRGYIRSAYFRDHNNFQHMILAEVITGNYKAGFRDLLYTDLCHSVVNNVQKPSIFVVFKSESAYPLYLLTYKSTHKSRPSSSTSVVYQPLFPAPVVQNPSQPQPPS